MFLTKRQKKIYEFLKEHIQGILRDKYRWKSETVQA